MNGNQATKPEVPSPGTEEVKPRRSVSSFAKAKSTIMLTTICLSLIIGFLGGWLGGNFSRRNGVNGSSTELAKRVIADESQLISNIAKNMGPSVVSINVISQTPQADAFGNVRTYQQESAGTGFIISDKGYILTNRHVVPSGAKTVSVTLHDGTTLNDVEVLGRTSDSDPLDVAFLRVKDAKGKSLQPVKIGDSSKVQVGYMVVAIGNALGQFQNTVTSGIISGFGRNVQAQGVDNQLENLQNLFQTDAAINQGNSGGPLVNADGEVIGINTAVAGDGAENIGFAIPIDDVRGLIKSVLEKGKLERPYLGVRYITLTDGYANEHNLNTKRGAYLAPGEGSDAPVLPGTPAAQSGLRAGDIIVKVNDQEINETNTLTSVLGRYAAGEEVTLTVIRNGQEQHIKVNLGVAP